MSPCVGPTRALLCAVLFLLVAAQALCGCPHMAAQVSPGCPEKCYCVRKEYEVRCDNASLTDLPSGGDLEEASTISLNYNNITTLKSNAFKDKNLLNVYILVIRYSGIKTVEEHAFRDLTELAILSLSFNDITNISSSAFETNSSLKVLNLSGNRNLQLPDAGFQLMDLVVLVLRECGLKSIPPKFFHSLLNLEDIYLNGNQLSSFDSRLVQPLTKLKKLDLEDNAFTSLQHDLFSVSPQSLEIHFTGNPLECECAMFDAYVLYRARKFQKTLMCKKPARVSLEDFFRSSCNKTLPSHSESRTDTSFETYSYPTSSLTPLPYLQPSPSESTTSSQDH